MGSDSSWAADVAAHDTRLSAVEAFEARIAELESAIVAPPPIPVALDPARGGFTLTHEDTIDTANDDDQDINLWVHEGEPDGVDWMLFNNEPVIQIQRREGDAQWKSNKGSRSEVLMTGESTIRYNEIGRYVFEYYFPTGGFTPSTGGPAHSTLFQLHGGSYSQSPMIGLRNWDGTNLEFNRENSSGGEVPMGAQDIATPLDRWLRFEVTHLLRPDNFGFSYVNAWDLSNGDVLAAEATHRYDGVTQVLKDGVSGVSAKSIYAYPKWGAYLGGGHTLGVRYYIRKIQVWTKK